VCRVDGGVMPSAAYIVTSAQGAARSCEAFVQSREVSVHARGVGEQLH
jgi:hypothetical protein